MSCVVISHGEEEPGGKYKGLPISHLDTLNDEQKEEMLKKAEKLREAAKTGDLTQIQELLKSGVVIDYPDDEGRSALCLAVFNEHPEACTYLLEAGAYATKGPTIKGNLKVGQDKNGLTPANYACRNNSRVLHAFLVAGVPIEELTPIPLPSEAETPIKIIPMKIMDKKEVEEYISQNKGLPVKYMNQLSKIEREEMIKKLEKLYEAAKENDVDTIKQLIKSGVVIDYPASLRDNCQSALHVAAMNNHMEACKVLLEAGATSVFGDGLGGGLVICADSNGYRPVDYAVENPKLLQLFLDAKVPVNSIGHFGCMLLHLAVEADAIDSVRLLIERGADVNAIAKVPTPYTTHEFSVVSFAQSTNVFEELLKNGAKPSQEEVDEICVKAAKGNHADFPETLKKYGFKQSEESILTQAALDGDTQTLKDAIERGTDINCSLPISGSLPKKLLTPLHCAAQNGHVDCVNLLIKAGANLETQDKIGATPLFFAVKNDHLDCVNVLIKSGANVNAQDKNGLTPLSCYVSAKCNIDIVKALLEAGADPTIKHKDNLTAINFVEKKFETKELLELLKQYIKPKK